MFRQDTDPILREVRGQRPRTLLPHDWQFDSDTLIVSLDLSLSVLPDIGSGTCSQKVNRRTLVSRRRRSRQNVGPLESFSFKLFSQETDFETFGDYTSPWNKISTSISPVSSVTERVPVSGVLCYLNSSSQVRTLRPRSCHGVRRTRHTPVLDPRVLLPPSEDPLPWTLPREPGHPPPTESGQLGVLVRLEGSSRWTSMDPVDLLSLKLSRDVFDVDWSS